MPRCVNHECPKRERCAVYHRRDGWVDKWKHKGCKAFVLRLKRVKS